MTKKIFIWCIFFAGPLCLFSQSPEQYLFKEVSAKGSKPALSFEAIEKYDKYYRSVDPGRVSLSRDGGYCSYRVEGGFVLRSTRDNWEQRIKSEEQGFFAGNNRQYIYKEKENLFSWPLGGEKADVLSGVAAYQLLDQEGRNEWMAIQFKDNSCILRNLLTGKEQRFSGVGTVSFHRDGEWFGCLYASGEFEVVRLSAGTALRYSQVQDFKFERSGLILKTAEGESRGLKWVDLTEGKVTAVWQSREPGQEVGISMIDKSGRRLAFMVQQKRGVKLVNSLWYYSKGMKEAVLKVDEQTAGMEAGLELGGPIYFTPDGGHILFSLNPIALPKGKPLADAVQVDVWHYRDEMLMSAQLGSRRDPAVKAWLLPESYKGVVGTESTSSILRLSQKGEKFRGLTNDQLVLTYAPNNGRFWERTTSYTLVSLKDGRRTALEGGVVALETFPEDGGWLFCWDQKKGRYLRYDVSTGAYTNLSASVPEWLGGESEFRPGQKIASGPGEYDRFWLEGRTAVLVYDYYDIWQLDPTGKKPAINLTGGYGRRHRVRFELLAEKNNLNEKGEIRADTRLVLSALNMDTKQTGFYALQLGTGVREPQRLSMENALVYTGRAEYGTINAGKMKPVRARDAELWVVRKESSFEAPNLYATSDMTAFKQLTDVKPLQGYNGYRSELVNYRQQDGTAGKGVLFRPEDFDSQKKYPVLIYYYQQESLRLNAYLLPGYTNSAHINIPWFVNRGYLVFVPDFYFTKASGSASALNAVEGAANWLSAQNYVDSTKLGITGHSTAGFATNYILTHSKRFAAVFEGAGGVDWVSAELQLSQDNGMPRLVGPGVENTDRIWRDRGYYLESPILHVDKVKSPLLMYHCKVDGAVPFEQAVELFTAMWRLGKKAWLLQYDEGQHSVLKNRDRRDLTVRVSQFFDHYLKGAPAPVWMTRGVPASLKGIETGLETDSKIKVP